MKNKNMLWLILLCISTPVFADNAVQGFQQLSSYDWHNLFSKDELFFIARIGMGLLLGILTGFTHDIKSKNYVGLRTYGGVALGAAAFTATATYLYLLTGKGNALQIIAGVTTGIGFLCAAVIFKEGSVVRGLATAASLWATAAVGIACGAGLFAPAIAITIVIVLFHFFPKSGNAAIDD
ncbi:MAG: hypothetical protein CMF49_06455 [Legionellales bacterium]|nr:hypothetical protein [Legionellales bacterium]|tara:strand:- start:314 stop:853 length:540 start_codon:yes stop_codon:yes gene_type:complete